MKKILISSQPYSDGKRNYVQINRNYAEAVKMAGAVPFIAPYTDIDGVSELVAMADAVILTGGHDVNPLVYGEELQKGIQGISNERDAFDLKLIEETIKANKPMLGICRGMQLINAYLGGTLYQDIYKANVAKLEHVSFDTLSVGAHHITIKEQSFLHRATGLKKMLVNTEHHQAVKDIAEGFKVTAKSSDGIIEAMEDVHRKIYLVQFHPEAMAVNNNGEAINIFKEFIKLQ
ncbi:gamma-glutamyl-gamma-aminobutyrate hydrolase family protein [Fenollaria timonensis]|uniref:gamma-glutamyl-gamma-aminobutyrate hydrolase family protein n=1 Tax=Fenollaria timonensis TaxID=1723384 RepID=UPI0026EF9BB7|nr:gamma-glutamyl-gamma-aminobutyrate hydrolase family protein [Fenollaria timonensis]